MSSNNPVKSSVNTVMGVKDATYDTTVQTDLENPRWDSAVTFKYIGATLAQIAFLIGLLWVMDIAWQSFDTAALPQWVITTSVCAFFAFVTLRSRLFSLLDNTRSNGRYNAIQRPGWAPPNLVFPIVWMSIAVLRVISAYLVWSALGQTFLSWPLILFVVHLSLGDTWNTIFTVEGRLGTAVPMVILGPWLSVAAVTLSYYQTEPVAGWIILPSWIWLTVATALCISIWRLNGREPLYPLATKQR